MKTLYMTTAVSIVLIVMGIFIAAQYKDSNVAVDYSPILTSTPISTPKSSKTPILTLCGNGGACTSAQIATHNTRNDCWIYLSPIAKVYDVTNYVKDPGKHPGGDVIISKCGTNIYDYFTTNANGGRKHSNKAFSILDSFYIGPLKK